MAQVPILRGHIKDGILCFHGIDAKRYKTILQHLEGREYELTLRGRQKKRSLNQNAWYWSCIVAMIAEAAGYSTEEAHEALKQKFLTIYGDSELPTVRSTTSLSTTEMVEYCERCRQLAAEMFGIYVPDPGEVEAA